MSDSATVGRGVRVLRPAGVDASASSRCPPLPYGCWPRNLMSIRRGSQRRLGRPSAVIAGATVTDSTVSVISRRQAADPLRGFAQPVDVVRTDDIALAPIAESGPDGVGVIERRGQLLQGLLARGPAQQSKLAELPDRVIEIRIRAFDRLVRLADLLLARARVGARRPWPSTPGPRPAPAPRPGRP